MEAQNMQYLVSTYGRNSSSGGQYWFGGNSFPGFLFKKNGGVGARKSTRFAPGGNIMCNQPTYIYNKYKPGSGGIGANSVATRRAKMIHATVCNGSMQCGQFYKYLGTHDNKGNPNGHF